MSGKTEWAFEPRFAPFDFKDLIAFGMFILALLTPKRSIRSLNNGTASMIANISSLLRTADISDIRIIMIRTGHRSLRLSECGTVRMIPVTPVFQC